jgi:hypothetical protein
MTNTLVYFRNVNASGKKLCGDVQHIARDFLPEDEKHQLAIGKLFSRDFERSLHAIPMKTLVTLFEKGLYSKFAPYFIKSDIRSKQSFEKYDSSRKNYLVGCSRPIKNSRSSRVARISQSLAPYIPEMMMCLDSIYYNYSLLDSSRNENPTYEFKYDEITHEVIYNYVNVPNHDKLTDKIVISDLLIVLRKLTSIGNTLKGRNASCAKKEFKSDRDNIIYQFIVMADFLSKKYSQARIAKKEADKQAMIAKKETRIAKKEADKQAMIAKKETDKQAMIAKKETRIAKKEADKQARMAKKESDKQARIAKKEADKQAKIIEKEKIKRDKIAEKEHAKKEKDNKKKAKLIAKEAVKKSKLIFKNKSIKM